MIAWYSSWRSDMTVGLPALGVPRQRRRLQPATHLVELDGLQHVGRERVRQQLARGACIDPTALHVEERRLVQTTDGRAVRALHVVGEDLELRLRIDLRLLGEEQGVVRLLAVGLLRP